LSLALPAVLAIASEPILSLADTAMIGRVGVEPLAARAIASSLFGGIYWFFSFLVFGTTTLVAHHYGAREKERCGEVAFHAALLGAVAGIVFGLALSVLAPLLFSVMGADDNVSFLGVPYFRVRLVSLPFFFLFYATAGFLRGIQNTWLPMLIAFAVNGLNIALDYAWIYGEFGFPALGLVGAAYASTLSQALGGMVCLKLLFFSRYAEQYGVRLQPLHRNRFLPLFRLSRELTVRTASLFFSLMFATATVARMGVIQLSSHEIALQLWMLVSYTTDGLAVAGQVLVAKYLGSGQPEKSYEIGKTLVVCGVVLGLCFTTAYLFFKEPLISLFTANGQVIETVISIFLLLALFQPLNGIVFVLDGILFGASDMRFLMKAMLAGAGCIFIPIAWLSLIFQWDLIGVWAGFTLFMLWRLSTNLTRFLGRRWYLNAAR
jgi:MATE family multidrug resistance protein